ncbi:hypothetical protein DQW50_05060 [Halorubrum sp. 48-1-W]|uniref:hypothetical protein n=1 Tax=Halorubrum sp. 48-1-W TaxID=2249761 RepID=UPI000DCCF321|nr:hypothetical protein [Halorubrum sp. 48-1-W]RAW46149.1 hypothetical protein DQW50_05060 [Halorubrum sp. 48-1-W]
MTGTGESRSVIAENERENGSTAEGTANEDEGTDTTPSEAATEESDHLADLKDGAGCTEIWEHLSENREE